MGSVQLGPPEHAGYSIRQLAHSALAVLGHLPLANLEGPCRKAAARVCAQTAKALMHNVGMSRVLKRALRQWREPFRSGRALGLKHDDFVAGWRQQRAKSAIDLLRVQAWNEQRLELLSCSFPGRQQRLYLRRWHLGSLQHNKQLLDKQVLAEYSLVRHCPHCLTHTLSAFPTHGGAVRIAAAVLL